MTILYQKNNMMHCTVLSLIDVLFGPCIPALVLLFCFAFFNPLYRMYPELIVIFTLFSFQKLQLQIELMFGGT